MYPGIPNQLSIDIFELQRTWYQKYKCELKDWDEFLSFDLDNPITKYKYANNYGLLKDHKDMNLLVTLVFTINNKQKCC